MLTVRWVRGTVAVALMLPLAAFSQVFPMFDSVAHGLGMSAGNAILARNTIRESARSQGSRALDNAPVYDRSGAAANRKPAAPTMARSVPTGIAKPTGMQGIESLVSGYPDAQKADMRQLFAQLIEAFEPVAGKLGVPAYDMGTAAAALVSGSYAAYHNQTLSEGHFKPLARQMQAVFANDANFARLSAADKQHLYQIMVGAGMFFTTIQLQNAKRPDPKVTALLRTAGADFLGKFTQLEVARVRLDNEGLSSR